MGNTNNNYNKKRDAKYKDDSDLSTLPRYFFFYDGLRDDTTGEYSYWNKEKCLKDLGDAKNAKLYGYKLYKRNWRNAYAVNTNNMNDYVIGRVLKFQRFDIFFSAKLTEVNKANDYQPENKDQRAKNLVKQVVANVYLENDNEKKEPIPAIVYAKHKDDSDLSKYTLIESNDWTKQNLIKSETKLVSNNTVSLSKGTTELRSSGHCTKFKEWKPNTDYKKDDIICINPTKKFMNHYIDTFQFWAMCMNMHTSNENNKPQKQEIFTDLTLNVIWFIKIYLIEHVKGFNNQLSSIIISYCYKTNNFWWNGCSPKDDASICVCGNLVAGILSTDFCKICIDPNHRRSKNRKPNTKALTEPIKGAVLTLNKTDGTRSRTFINNFDDEKKLFQDENIILRTNIVSNIEKQKIYNLMTRNFNEDMEPLIKACIYNDKEFTYKHDDGKVINVGIGDANIWCLYGIDNENINNEQLLCALIWRYVHGESTNQTNTYLMFEVLFVSVYENVRFNHYGQEMVKQIELYCMANDYDLMTVAAVPGHGEKFWRSNGFELKHYAVKNKENNEKKSGSWGKNRYNEWMRLNMLVFDDTPLFAKLLH